MIQYIIQLYGDDEMNNLISEICFGNKKDLSRRSMTSFRVNLLNS